VEEDDVKEEDGNEEGTEADEEGSAPSSRTPHA
jgi:hypothetical protein